ncbi:hypothetical protein [Terribacillus saccharophilus]|uniref:hypothetical protein n=1 Tax=Terribacillus saccharophilus TaxID=361277 RepID=UPI002DCBEEB1|nr:hypothetical protein [Terribacillus saccharophilus]
MTAFTYVPLVVGIIVIVRIIEVFRRRNRRMRSAQEMAYHRKQIKTAWITGSGLIAFVALAQVIGWIHISDILHVLLAYLIIFTGDLIFHSVCFYRLRNAIQSDM